MRRAILPWLVAVGILVGAAVTTVATLNATVFGASGFVRVYLDAVARGDAASALELPGVGAPAEGVSDALLAGDALAGLSEIRVTDDVESEGVHVVTVAWDSPGGAGESTFRIERIGTRFGLFPEWGFAESPLATLTLKVLHEQRFTVNQLDTRSPIPANAPQQYAVLVPGSYRLGHATRYFDADPVTVIAENDDDPLTATLDIRPNSALDELVTTEVRGLLDACAAQAVLFPTGCPLGQSFSGRIVSEPRWTIVAYPAIQLQPGVDFGTWQTVRTTGTAHLVVDVQSLFDGSVSTFDEDVTFAASFLVTVFSDTEVEIDVQL